jgi:uracil phosphoribosyltransferase
MSRTRQKSVSEVIRDREAIDPEFKKNMDIARQMLAEEHAEHLQWRDHDTRELVNKLRDVAIEFGHTQQLRERICHVVLDAMDKIKKIR